MGKCPFQIMVAADPKVGYWEPFWRTEANSAAYPIQFYVPGEASPFAPLGDIFAPSPGKFPFTSMLYKPSDDVPDALAHPVDYEWVLDDHGSGNSNDVSYYWPIAPVNYVALGVVWRPLEKPGTNEYWCVHERYCVRTGWIPAWSDQGQGWSSHDGDLVTASIPNPAPPNATWPQTYLSMEAMQNGMGAPYVLSWS